MTINGTQDWHSVEPQATDNTTVRQPTPQYDTLHIWAKDAQLSEVFELTALTFGFSKHFTVIGNLNQELSHPESLEILAAWSNNPLVALLSDLRQAFTDSSDIAIEFPALPHAGNSDQTKKKLRDLGASIEKRHFLLCLIVNPLAIANTEEQYALRRALRIWLIVQALDHAANRRCLSDKRIQKVASFLTQNTHHNNWLIIDKTLERAKRHVALQPFTFDRFTLALRNAANELFVQSQDASAQRFLNSLALICEGNCEPNELENVAQPFFHAPLAIFSRNRLPETQQLSDYQFQSLDLLDAPNDESDENSEEALLYTVNADDPPERQRLTGQSILLQTTELSHYLPWSWDKPLPPELQSLNAWINQLLTSNNQLDRLGAAVVWLATRLSRSLPFTLELAISSTTQNEWALMPDFSVAHRHSPKRHHSWVPDQNAIQCIEPFESSLSLKIPGVVQQALNGAFESAVNSNHSLYNLWFQLSGETPETWFNRHAKDHFPRLTSAKLANAHPQQVFNLTSDHSFARLSAAHPRAALPAACGYANWDIKAVENGFNLELSGSDKAGDSRVNVLGSLLAPLESLLIDQISQATQALNDTQWDSPLSYHNALARYCVMALYAATGCRHLSDPFESITHFCSEPPSVFINDKADDGLHNGRLVPLPLGAWNLVEMYKTHLGELAKVIEPVRSDLAEEISQLRKQPSAKLPLFFLLDEAIHWRSLSDRSIPDTEWFNWPLPSNLFRHRYAQQLARSGVDTEVIDGWMGHAERGVATYSDLSVRCWIDDYQAYSQTLNDVFERLAFQVPRTLGQLPPIGEPTTLIKPIAQESRLFGVKKRRQNRIASLKKAKDLADSDLDLFLGSKTLEELDDDQTQAMSHLMLMRENGLPHPQAAIRYAVMMERLDALEDESAKPIRRRLVTIDTEQSLLTDQSPVALTILPKLQGWAKTARSATDKANVSKSEALLVAAALLIIDKRLGYSDLIDDVTRGIHYRLVQNKKKLYFEYNEDLDEESYTQPVQRHEVDYKTASLLQFGKGIKSIIDLTKPISSKHLQTLSEVIQTHTNTSLSNAPALTNQWLLEQLITLINQANLILMPGIVSAALSGRQPPTSCSLADYFRLHDDILYHPPEPPSIETASAASARYPLKLDASDNKQLYANTQAFFEGIRSRLTTDTKATYTKATAREVANDIRTFTSDHTNKVTSAITLIGYWLADRIQRGKGRRGAHFKPYAITTPARYFGALREAFQGLAYHLDLTALDEEDITALCSEMITLKRSNLEELDYFGARLQEFFRWAAKSQNVAEPIWEELDFGSQRRSVRPGLFSESEYQTCLHAILSSSASLPDHAQLTAFILILAYRFGLRAQEAIGLQRTDWCESGDLTWVLIRNNPYRGLKRPSSRRAVPLMFPLSDQEKSTIQFVFNRYDSLASHTPKAPILCTIDKGELAISPFARHHMPNAISQVLKQVTGNPLMTLHHARHSFCNLLALALFDFETPLTKKLSGHLNHAKIRQILLGNGVSSTRRSAMALARAMGHATPRTGFKSYNRMVSEWAEALTPVSNRRTRTIPNAVQTRDWVTQKSSDHSEIAHTLLPTSRPSPRTIAQALRLKALGHFYDHTEAALQLYPDSLKDMDWLANQVNNKHRFKIHDFKKNKPVQVYGTEYPNLLLTKVSPDAWVRIIGQAAEFPPYEELDLSSSLPPVNGVPSLIGRNGHLLMNSEEDRSLIRLVLDLFKVPEASYNVYARYNDPDVKKRLLKHGFKVSPIVGTGTGAKPQLDTFNKQGHESEAKEQEYGGLIFNKGFSGCIHRRNELVIALLIVAASYCSLG